NCRYRKLCATLQMTAKSAADLGREAESHGLALLPVTSITLKSGRAISLGDSRDAAKTALGGFASTVPVSSGESYYRLGDPESGVQLVASQLVLVIRLTSPKGPPLPLRARGSDRPVIQLSIGMAKEEAEKVLQKQRADSHSLDDPSVVYRYYPDLGIGVR